MRVRSLLAIASIHGFPSRSIDFVLAFTLSNLGMDVLMEIPLGIGVDGNRVEWILKLNKSLYGLKQEIDNWFDLLKTSCIETGDARSNTLYGADEGSIVYFRYFYSKSISLL